MPMGDQPPVKVGVQLAPPPEELGEWLADASAFDAAGAAALWLDPAPGPDVDPLALLAALAVITSRSLLVAALPEPGPAGAGALARTLATIGRLSHGGLARGSRRRRRAGCQRPGGPRGPAPAGHPAEPERPGRPHRSPARPGLTTPVLLVRARRMLTSTGLGNTIMQSIVVSPMPQLPVPTQVADCGNPKRGETSRGGHTTAVPESGRGGRGRARSLGSRLRRRPGQAGPAAPAHRGCHCLAHRLPLLRGRVRDARVHQEGRERKGRAAPARG